jgi:hypothetical protein
MMEMFLVGSQPLGDNEVAIRRILFRTDIADEQSGRFYQVDLSEQFSADGGQEN